ncbi:ABC transporter permease subunit [Pokkaliibacter sp. CJK22405]|uniref:ABC transporter permease subunit n=1 Tax=Pokkaliibacter sp. CJK22405 TaxID=3384615 RepID=UPI00398510D4
MKKFNPIAQLARGRNWVISLPYVWLLLFFFIPFLIVLKLSLSEAAVAIPPFNDILEYSDEVLSVHLNFGNFLFLLSDDLYFLAYLFSLKTAFFATILCLLVGYPMAYFMTKASPSTRNVLLMLVILPSWTSFLIRIYAWIGILKDNGVLNNFLMWLGVINEPLTILNTNVAVYIGIVYAYLPFMILPLYANLLKLDHSLLEAASDLGCRPWKSFFKVTLPLSRSGIIAGSMLVFIPAVGEFVIPSLLGGANTLMIGKVLWQEFFNNRDWPLASAVAVIMLALLLIPIALFNRHQAKEAQSEKE